MRSPSSHLLACATAMCLAGGSVRADSVWINGSGLRGVTSGPAISGQTFSTGEAGGVMQIHAGTPAASDFSLSLPSTIGMPIAFRVDFSPSLGYRFSIGNASQSHSLIWGLAPNVDAGPILGDVGDPSATGSGVDASVRQSRSTERLDGSTAFARAFNTLRFNAFIASEEASLQVADLRFDSYGALDVASGELASSSSLFSSGASAFSQSIFSDVDLSGINWSMSGSLWTTMAGPVTIAVDQSDSQFIVVPLPPAATAALATLAGVIALAAIRRRRLA